MPKNSASKVPYAVVITALLLGGCAKSVQVTSDFPKPLLQPYPLKAGVRYPVALAEYSHTEQPSNEPEVTISLGEANLKMFRALFAGMFQETIELGADASAPIPGDVDLVIEPNLVDLEIASPDKSGTDQYTVWLNYTLKLYRADRSALGDWNITAYGQYDAGSLGMGAEAAIADAATIALRDAAATIATEFVEAPGISQLLAIAAPAQATGATLQPAESADD